ncbi:MAG: hypothetical protein WCO77_11945, partial [bacterium]
PMIIIILIGILIAVVDDFTRHRRLIRYWRRPCMGRDWRRSFPNATKDDIRNFLNTFVDAFMLRNKNRLKFNPSDKLMDVYCLMYPPSSFCDALELETFALTIEEEYGVDLTESKDLEHITLGEIFEMTRNSNKGQQGTSLARRP